MNPTYYVCKYTPIELLTAFGARCENLNGMQNGFDQADQIAHPNLCGFGKSLIEAVLAGQVKELVLVNCCDTIRSVCDVLQETGRLDFLYLVDMLHGDGVCSRERTVAQLKVLARAYADYKGTAFDPAAFRAPVPQAGTGAGAAYPDAGRADGPGTVRDGAKGHALSGGERHLCAQPLSGRGTAAGKRGF